MDELGAPKIGAEQVNEWMAALRKYQAAKRDIDKRAIEAENWWRLRNTRQEIRAGMTESDRGQFRSTSGWLHNVIVSKHADAMDSYPEPNILPREQGDRQEATMLASIIPAVLEQNHFEGTYSDAMWQKLKTGTGVYKIMWDASKLNGLGDISIQRVSLLNLFWEPNVVDIQDSKYLFHTEATDKETLEEMYPAVRGRLKGNNFLPARYTDESKNDEAEKVTVVEVYYHRYAGQKKILHYCKFVNDIVLYATENEAEAPTRPEIGPDGMPVAVPVGQSMAERGLYDHGLYPFVFDRLFPVESSPCGYGFVDLCWNPQTEIDLLKTSFLKNAMVGATPRYFVREDGEINEEEMLDLNNPLVHVSGNLGEDSLRPIEYKGLDGNYVTHLQNTIQELRETSGNTETATGSSHGGATAASAIAALQEASGKGSRDATQNSYRAFSAVCYMVIELIRQFYDLPRQFRIVGEYGAERFISYSNAGLKPQNVDPGGYRLPVFDIKVVPQKQSPYSKQTQNELALQFYNLGFFDPQNADRTLMCLDMMDFDGKDELQQKVAQQGTIYQQLLQWQQMALSLAQQYAPELVQGLAGAVQPMQAAGGGAAAVSLTMPTAMENSDEALGVRKARAQSRDASRPGE